MSLSWNKPIRNLGPRIALWFIVTVMVSVTVVSATIYFLLSASLRRVDHEFIEARSLDYIQVYERSGLEGLKTVVAEQRRESREDELLISLEDDQNTEVFTYMPSFLDHDEEDPEELLQVKTDAANLQLKPGWQNVLILSNDGTLNDAIETWMRRFVLARGWDNILPLLDHDLFEIYIVKIGPNLWMKIGKNPEFREDHLMRVRKIGFMVLLPVLAISFLIGLGLIWRLLAPIRRMMTTISQLQQGNRHARVPVGIRGDELDRLAQEFNGVLDANEQLVTGMRQTLDNIAHDLRTPLTRFHTGAEVALNNPHDVELVKEILQTGIESSASITALLNAIMEVAQAETGTLLLNMTKLPLQQLIAKVVDAYQSVAEDKHITINLMPSEDITIQADRVRLSQCFGNLLDNAVKYSPDNSTITVRIISHAAEVEIQIEDQGIGISATDLPRIFNRLYRADASRSTQGAGIGLSLVKAIVTAHHGRIEVDGQRSPGSRFSVFLPHLSNL